MSEQRYQRAVMVFRRDLRVVDNTALTEAATQAKEVLCTFVLDPRQIKPHPYRSRRALGFMAESLQDLDRHLRDLGNRLVVVEGDPQRWLTYWIKMWKAEACFVNEDVTPFSRQRDEQLARVCRQHFVAFRSFRDVMLVPDAQDIRTGNGTPYRVFTPFYQSAKRLQIPEPQPMSIPGRPQVFPKRGTCALQALLENAPPSPVWTHGGRRDAQRRMDAVAALKDGQRREWPADEQETSGLSPHLKFGTISPRELYRRVLHEHGDTHPLIRQLYWRDFYMTIAWHFPHVFGAAFQEKFDEIPWSNDKDAFERWCAGETGFPLIDAGMRQLNITGWMHNRVRMTVASFLCKDLGIDWRWGERYFARQLVDYDPALNNGNWQWAASTGADAQPYFRIFNPWRQQERFDPEAIYIKRWVPGLRSLDAETIHGLHAVRPVQLTYPTPMLNHEEAAKAAKLRYKAAS